MRKLDNNQLLTEFYGTIKDIYPDISYEQLKEVCFGPWRMLKHEMESGNLNSVRFMYFGMFQVKEARIKEMQTKLPKLLAEGKITENKFKEVKIILDNYEKRKAEYKK